MRPRAPTPRQMEALRVVVAWYQEHGTGVTLAVIAERLGVTPQAAWKLVDGLRERGLVEERPTGARGVEPADGLPRRGLKQG